MDLSGKMAYLREEYLRWMGGAGPSMPRHDIFWLMEQCFELGRQHERETSNYPCFPSKENK